MKLLSITLRNYRGIEERTIEFDDHITVVAGPNEVGKSSIAEALRLLRTELDSTGKRAVKEVQTVGSDQGPEAEITVRTGAYLLTYRKRWLKKPETVLVVREPVPEQWSGREAHERYAAILAETTDVDLLEALETRQGKSFDQPDLVHLKALQGALGDERPSNTEDHLLSRVEEEYLRYFTATGKPTGEYREVSADVDAARERVTSLEADSAEMQRLTDEHAQVQHRIATLEDTLEANSREYNQRRQEASSAEAVQEALQLAEADTAAAARQSALAEAVVASRRAMVQQLADEKSALEQRSSEVDQLSRARSRAEEDRAQALAARDMQQAAVDAAASAERDARRMLDRARSAAELDHLQARLTAAKTAEEQRRLAAASVAANCVDEETLQHLTELHSALLAATAASESAAALLSIEVFGEQPVVLGSDEITAGQNATVPVLDTVSIEIDGIARMSVRPAKRPEELQQQLDEAHTALHAALEAADVDSLESARQAALARHEASRRLERATLSLDHALDGLPLAELEDQVAKLRASCEEDPPLADASLLELEQSVQACERERAAREETLAPLIRAATTCSDAAEKAVSQHDKAQAALDALATNHSLALAKLDLDRATSPDAQLEAEAAEAKDALHAAQAVLDDARRACAAIDIETIRMWLANAEGNRDTAEAQLNQARSRLTELGALLDDRARLGIFDALTQAKAQLDAVEARYARLQRAATAAALLRETLLRHRWQAQARYVAPFQQRLEQLGRIVFGKDVRIGIDATLRIVSRTLDGRTIMFDQLSGGAKEQLALLGRLTCAQLVDPEGGAPLIVDDALGFSDPERLRALGLALDHVGQQAQIILLTCQPDRYQQVGRARRVDLY